MSKSVKRFIKLKKSIFYFAICLGISISFFGYLHDCRRVNSNIKSDPSNYAMGCIEITPTRIIFLESLNLDNFTATGFTYDSMTDSFWIGDHGTNPDDEVKLIQVSSDFSKVLSIIQVGDCVNDGVKNLQGIAYNPQSDSILCAMGEEILEVDKRGGG